ncbi:hypothetical protein [Botrimarina sp.]|uniref:shikimate dehydrogenase family protein n=1 Tax=Botrimarina sp. TaxID=2795802 RepID=UPI0032EFC6E2
MSNLLTKCCLVGESVAGDPTHFMIERALEQMGLDWRFLSFQPLPERLGEALTGLDAVGVQGVRLLGAYADKPAGVAARTARSTRTGRVTHLTRHEGRLQGDDATGPALVEALAPRGEPAGKRVVVLGAGGAAPSVVDVLVEHGAAMVGVADPSSDRAAAVVLSAHSNRPETAPTDAAACDVRTLAWEDEWVELPDAVDWLVSTAAWPKADNPRVAQLVAPELGDTQLVLDLGIGSSRSPLLLAAESRGRVAVDGLPILVAETALAVEAWTGLEADRTVLRDAAEEFLGL